MSQEKLSSKQVPNTAACGW